MRHLVFLINGYGVPKDIFTDGNYQTYLNVAFNTMFDLTQQNPGAKPLIIFSGGPTDCFRPYRRTEAGEMAKYFRALIRQRPAAKPVTRRWQIVLQARAVTAVENLVYEKEIIERKRLKNAHVYYFSEYKRGDRSKILAQKAFGKSHRLTVVPVDFDVSANRYLDPQFRRAVERKTLLDDLWALKSPQNLKKWRHIYLERLAVLRKAGPARHVEAVKQWWEKKLREIRVR